MTTVYTFNVVIIQEVSRQSYKDSDNPRAKFCFWNWKKTKHHLDFSKRDANNRYKCKVSKIIQEYLDEVVEPL